MPGIQYSMIKNIKNKNNNNARSQKNSQSRKALTVTSAPVAKGVTAWSTPPNMAASGDKVVIKRREFVGTATNGTVTGYALTPVSASTPGYDFNPSEATMFPWLSQLAPCFERFRFDRLSFDFIPSQASSTAGRYYAAVDYDYDDAVAVNKTMLMGNMTAMESAVWQPMSIKCDPRSLNRDLPYRYVSCTTRVRS